MSCCPFMGSQVFQPHARFWMEKPKCGIEFRTVMRHNSTYRAQGSSESDSGGLRWTISAWGSETPFTVELRDVEQSKQAISITNDDLLVIADVIRRKRSPFPKRALANREDAPIEVDGPFKAGAASFDLA